MDVSAGPRQLTVESGSAQVVLEDVLVGEVWLVSGRSNIGFSVSRMTNAAEESVRADRPMVRLLQVATKDPSLTLQETFTSKGWSPASPQAVKGFSAVGWVFGSELQMACNVPAGIVMSSGGGSQPIMWIEQSACESARGRKDPPQSASPQGAAFEKETQAYHKAGDGQSAEKVAGRPGACFNSHILPLIPMAMKGALVFFDGAAADDIALLAANWRNLRGAGDFPFLFVQVHRRCGEVETDPNAKGDSFRSSCIGLLKTIPNSAMVVALAVGSDDGAGYALVQGSPGNRRTCLTGGCGGRNDVRHGKPEEAAEWGCPQVAPAGRPDDADSRGARIGRVSELRGTGRAVRGFREDGPAGH